MSFPIRDAIKSHEVIARNIQAFLWEGKPHKSEPVEHSVEEYRKFLEELHSDAWCAYDTGAQALGWKE